MVETMRWNQHTEKVGTALRASAWWVTIAPFCLATDLPDLATSTHRPLYFGREPDNYPITELLGRLLSFRGRVRFARAIIIFVRAAMLAGLILLLAKTIQLSTRQPMSGWLPVALLLLGIWTVHLALHHSISPFEVARLVDRRLSLQEQVATAVESTTGDRLERALSRTQVRLATSRLRDVDPVRALPLVIPWRDLRGLAGIVVLYGVVGFIGSLGLNLPVGPLPVEAELAKQAGLQAQAPSPFVTVDPNAAQLVAQTQGLLNAQAGSGPVKSDLDALRQQLQSQQITPQQYQDQLRQVQQRLESMAKDSLSAQQALGALADSLKDASATQSISDSLNRGDYQKAGDQLTDLSKQVGQLSPDARSELADRLAQASSRTQQSNESISKDTGQAANALKNGDISTASQSLDSLANSVKQASQKISTQSQLGQQMQDVRQQLGDSASNSAAASTQPNSNGTNPSQSADPQGQPPNASGNQDPSKLSSRADGSAGDPTSGAGDQYSAAGQVASRSSTQSIQSDQPGTSAGVGTTPGGNPLSGNQPSLDTRGVRLTIVGQANGPGTASTSAGDRSVPLTAAGDSGLAGSGGPSSVQSNVPINVHQESNQVPLDRKPVVRDYFSNAGP